MMRSLIVNFRYYLPLHFILQLTNFLPDNIIFLRLRGWLARPFFGACGKDLRLGRSIDFYNPINVIMGDHVYLSFGCVLLADDKIILGDDVIIGPYSVLASSNHTRKDSSYRFSKAHLAPISIGKGSWIGAHCVITAGSRIGSGSVIAAGAAVSGNIPDGVLAGGVPAREIKALDD